MGSSSDSSVDASVIGSRWFRSYPSISTSHGDDRCASSEPAWTTNVLEQTYADFRAGCSCGCSLLPSLTRTNASVPRVGALVTSHEQQGGLSGCGSAAR